MLSTQRWKSSKVNPDVSGLVWPISAELIYKLFDWDFQPQPFFDSKIATKFKILGRILMPSFVCLKQLRFGLTVLCNILHGKVIRETSLTSHCCNINLSSMLWVVLPSLAWLLLAFCVWACHSICYLGKRLKVIWLYYLKPISHNFLILLSLNLVT